MDPFSFLDPMRPEQRAARDARLANEASDYATYTAALAKADEQHRARIAAAQAQCDDVCHTARLNFLTATAVDPNDKAASAVQIQVLRTAETTRDAAVTASTSKHSSDISIARTTWRNAPGFSGSF